MTDEIQAPTRPLIFKDRTGIHCVIIEYSVTSETSPMQLAREYLEKRRKIMSTPVDWAYLGVCDWIIRPSKAYSGSSIQL